MRFSIPVVLPHSFVPEEEITEIIGGRKVLLARKVQNNAQQH